MRPSHSFSLEGIERAAREFGASRAEVAKRNLPKLEGSSMKVLKWLGAFLIATVLALALIFLKESGKNRLPPPRPMTEEELKHSELYKTFKKAEDEGRPINLFGPTKKKPDRKSVV